MGPSTVVSYDNSRLFWMPQSFSKITTHNQSLSFFLFCFNSMHTVLTLLSYVAGYFVHVANHNNYTVYIHEQVCKMFLLVMVIKYYFEKHLFKMELIQKCHQ